MSAPTVLIGILPTYHTIGITATILMIVVKILQGLSMGGALIGSISFVMSIHCLNIGILPAVFQCLVYVPVYCLILLFLI